MEFELFGNKIFFTRLIANALNLIVLTAALSVYNSSVYSNSRMLYGLADQGNAPGFLKKLNKQSVPINAILISSCFAALCILINKVIPKEAFSILMSLVVSSLVINWVMISYTHLKFRRSKDKEGTKTKFASLFYPVSNYICFVFLLGILSIMWMTDMKLSVELIPIWLGILFIFYKVFKTKKK